MIVRPTAPGRLAACALAGLAALAPSAQALEIPRGETVETLALVVEAEPDRAGDALEALRETARRDERPRAEGLALWGLAALRLKEDRPAEARELAAAGRETLQTAGDGSSARDAASLEAESDRLLEGGEPRSGALTAHVRERLGILSMQRFRLGEALRHFDAGLTAIEGRGHTVQEAGLHAYRGMILALFQRFEPAQADMDRFVELATDAAPELEPVIAFTRELVLGVATWEWEPAIRELERIAERYGEGLPPWFAQNLDLIRLLQEGRAETAAGVCRKVLGAAVAARPEPSGGPEAAMDMACAGLDVVAAAEEGGMPARDLLAAAAAASRLVESQPEPVRQALELLTREFLDVAGRPDQADRWAADTDFQEPLAALETLLARATPPEMRSGVDGPFSRFIHLFVDLKADAGDPEAAFELAEEARARELLDRLVDARLVTADPAVAARIADLRERRDDLGRRLAEALRAEGAADPGDLEAELAGVRRELDAAFDRLALRPGVEEARRQPLPVAEIQRALSEDTTLVAYLTFSDGLDDTLAWVVDRHRVEQVALPVRVDELERRIAYFLETLRRREPVEALAEALYDSLWAPLQERLRTRRVLLVPHGPLQELPFAALRDPERGLWLTQQATLLQAPSATAWARLHRRAAGRADPPVVLGDGAGDLPAAASEAREVASLWGVPPLVGARATEEAFRSRAPGASLVHVSTHGVADPHDPLFSRLRLAPSPEASDDPSRDGRLELHEVVNELDLTGTGLVILPACDAGRGPRTPGGEVTSLARAFLLAGARGVLTARWDVEDAGTAPLMLDLHRHLAAGAGAAEALRRAQEAALASVDRSHPWSWAGFSLHGAGGPVRAARSPGGPAQPSTAAGVQPEERPRTEGDPWWR